MHEGRGRAPSESDPPAAPKGVVQVGSNTRHRIAPGTRTFEVELLQRSVDLQGVGQRGGARGWDIIVCTTYMHTQHMGAGGWVGGWPRRSALDAQSEDLRVWMRASGSGGGRGSGVRVGTGVWPRLGMGIGTRAKRLECKDLRLQRDYR